jgi:hypothetical protein
MAEQPATKRPSAAFDVAVSRMASLAIASRKRPTRTNFPLPRELRDQIYRYLLHSDYTRVERKWTGNLAASESNDIFERKGYKFHTNILAVNRAIHDEAQDYLYKNNIFVVATANWFDADGDSLFTFNSYIPVVTESKVARMRHHSIRMHVTKGVKAPTQSCLLLLKDLDALIVTLRFHASQRLAFALMMEDDLTSSRYRFMPVGIDGLANKAIKSSHFKVHFFNTPWHKTDVNTQRNVLDSLCEFNSNSMRVTIDGILAETIIHAQRAQDMMGAALISPLALDSFRLDTYYKQKRLADKAVCANELGLAEVAYKIMRADIGLHMGAQEGVPSRTHRFSTLMPLSFLAADVFLTLYYLQLKLGRCTRIEWVLECLRDFLAKLEHAKATKNDPSLLDLVESAESACRHLILLTELYWHDSRSIGPRLKVSQLVREFSVGKHLPYNSYDLATLSKVSD